MVTAAHTSAAQPLASGTAENDMITQRVALAAHPDAPPAANSSIALTRRMTAAHMLVMVFAPSMALIVFSCPDAEPTGGAPCGLSPALIMYAGRSGGARRKTADAA
jgi:hypothetical protein